MTRYSSSEEPDDRRLFVVPGSAVPASGGIATDAWILTAADIGFLVACDLDGDGLPELVTGAGIWAGTDLLTPGASAVAPALSGLPAHAACLGDLDGDGTEDLAAPRPPWSYEPV